MSDEVKYTGPTTLAKNTALVKAELGKKLDKTGGTLTGDLTISGAWLNVKSTDTGDGNISVDGSLVAGRGVSVLNGGKSVSLVCTGDNAAKIAGSGNNCARLAVGTPTGDNDAATKKYVDDHSASGEKYVVESTSISDGVYDAERKKTKYTLTFNKTNNEIISALNSGKDVQFKVTFTEGNETYPVYFSVGYTRVDVFNNVPVYMFVGSMGELDHSVITVYGVTDSDETFRPYLTTTGGILPEPNPDDSDDGKVLVVNKHKWEMKKPKEDFVVTITVPPSPVPTSVNGGIAQFTVSCDKTFDEIKAAIDAGKNVFGKYANNIWPLSYATDTMVSFAGVINFKYFEDASNASCIFTIQSNETSIITCAAGELPAVSNKVFNKVLVANNGHWDLTDTLPSPNSDGSDNGKVPIVNGTRWEMKKAVVDDALSDTSTNPVQNKAVKEALDGKLSTRGGEISGYLEVGQTVSAEGSVSVGRTSSDTGIHFEKAASNAGRISHGSDPMTGVAPIARLKVADPTDDDDAATKKYVDGRAVRYDAAQGLTSDQKFVACANIGAVNQKGAWMEGSVVLLPRGADGALTINITPIENSNDYMLALDGGPENVPVYVSGLETPTDAQTDCAANVAYVKAKIAEVAASGGVDVDNALSATSTNPVQNKVITSALNGKADKSELGNKADKTALDAKADKTALDAKMDKSGGTFTGNVYGKYFCGTWLQSTAASNLGRTPGKIAVMDDSGWVYYRTPAELLADIGGMPSGDYYTKAEVDAAIAVRASTSVYGTTKLSNSTTSSSKTLAATPYAVKTALAQAKAYVDSAIAVAINSAY